MHVSQQEMAQEMVALFDKIAAFLCQSSHFFNTAGFLNTRYMQQRLVSIIHANLKKAYGDVKIIATLNDPNPKFDEKLFNVLYCADEALLNLQALLNCDAAFQDEEDSALHNEGASDWLLEPTPPPLETLQQTIRDIIEALQKLKKDPYFYLLKDSMPDITWFSAEMEATLFFLQNWTKLFGARTQPGMSVEDGLAKSMAALSLTTRHETACTRDMERDRKQREFIPACLKDAMQDRAAFGKREGAFEAVTWVLKNLPIPKM